ncbi:unnamed protein product [Closterium sp. Naga37s-1]|nr:unnamed protein product [Closterium sp. Naga37s-1]
MVRWIPLTLQTIHDHVAVIARDLGKPPSFRCSVGWVRRALRRNGIRCQSAAGEAADQDMAAVRTCKEKLPQLLMHLSVSNFDETAVFLSVLPRKTYGRSRVAGRKIPKERLTVGLLAVVAKWVEGGATTNLVRYKPNLRDILAWLLDAWMNIGSRTIQGCWWRTECLPLASALSLSHVGAAGLTPGGGGVAPLAIDLDGEIDDVGILIDQLGLGPSAMPAADFVAIDAGQPTCAEPREDPLALEPATVYSAASWEAPTSMEAVYNDDNPASREARRYARAACEMLIGYARATSITPRKLCALFEMRNPIIIERMERPPGIRDPRCRAPSSPRARPPCVDDGALSSPGAH